MADMGSENLSWRVKDPLEVPQLSASYSAFKSYGKMATSSFTPDSQFNSQRIWNGSGGRGQHQQQQNGGAVNGNLPGPGHQYNSQNGENSRDMQPLYLNKIPEQFRKGRPQKSQFRMNSPTTVSLQNTKSLEPHMFDSTLGRVQSPSPTTMWSGVPLMKQSWPPAAPSSTTDHQGQMVGGLAGLTLTEGLGPEVTLGSGEEVPVELLISNLDQNIDAREIKRILFTVFRDHVMVLHVSVFVQSDGNLAATLRVPSPQDAQYAISQLHRKKIGAKRIIISYVNHNQPSPELKRSKVIALLQEVPGKKLPLFKFRELYEKRFHETVGVSEMYNMKNIVMVSDNSTGRMVSLHPEFRNVSSPVVVEACQEVDDCTAWRVCKVHSVGPDDSVGWAERDQDHTLPNVQLGLRTLAASIHSLLQSHSGTIPLASLVDCYRVEVGPLEECEEGVPLEHLVSCLPGVCIVTATAGYKYIKWVEDRVVDEAEELARCVSPPLVGQLTLFTRELVDLLKTFPHCRLLFSRFIPAYHHHFGRQCRVADYGFTKLADLFDALPHIIQVLGEGTKRTITLAHKAQLKRFSSDLLRVLKSQPTKSISLEAFPAAYEKTLSRLFKVTDYGVCDMEDLLSEVNETTVIVSRSEQDTTIAIPKREQTPEEIERTRQFATEVVELLRHSPQCKMPFNRFIPAYHHHFGRQCRVADFGFSKLIELFEAIPDMLQVFVDEDGEKQLQLVEAERLRVLGEQVCAVVRGAPRQALKLSALTQVFTRYYGHSLRAEHYGTDTMEELIGKLRSHVKLMETGEEPVVSLVDRGYVHEVMMRVRKLLWEEPTCSLKMEDFIQRYTHKYSEAPSLEILQREMEDVLVISGEGEETKVSLVPVQIFARNMVSLLQEAGGRMLLLHFDTAYLDRYGVACRPATYGFPNMVALVQALGDLVTVKGRGSKKILLVNRESVSASLPPTSHSTSIYSDHPDERIVPSEPKPPPASQLPTPTKVSSPHHCDYQRTMQDPSSSSHLVMSMNAPTHQSFQPSSPPVLYPGSPAPTGSSVIWGQMWSPQYPVIPPLSPAHYMVPTIPMSWGSVPASPVGPAISTTSSPTPLHANTAPPISIHTLDQLSIQSGGQCEEYSGPPSASELPPPELFTHVATPRLITVTAPPLAPVQQDEGTAAAMEGEWESGEGEAATPATPKLHIKRRIAAQFTGN